MKEHTHRAADTMALGIMKLLLVLNEDKKKKNKQKSKVHAAVLTAEGKKGYF